MWTKFHRIFLLLVILTPLAASAQGIVTAVVDGNDKKVAEYLSKDCSLAFTNPDAVIGGNYGNLMCLASFEGYGKIVRRLAECGLSVNGRSSFGSTPLILAATFGHYPVVAALLKLGANPNTTDGDGITALMASAAGGYDDCIRVLLQNGADREVRDNNYVTAEQWAQRQDHTDSYLIIHNFIPPKTPSQIADSLNSEAKSQINELAEGEGGGSAKKALEFYKESLRYHKTPEAYQGIGEILEASGDSTAAFEKYREASEQGASSELLKRKLMDMSKALSMDSLVEYYAKMFNFHTEAATYFANRGSITKAIDLLEDGKSIPELMRAAEISASNRFYGRAASDLVIAKKKSLTSRNHISDSGRWLLNDLLLRVMDSMLFSGHDDDCTTSDLSWVANSDELKASTPSRILYAKRAFKGLPSVDGLADEDIDKKKHLQANIDDLEHARANRIARNYGGTTLDGYFETEIKINELKSELRTYDERLEPWRGILRELMLLDSLPKYKRYVQALYVELGKSLFSHSLYADASHCFRLASDPQAEVLALKSDSHIDFKSPVLAGCLGLVPGLGQLWTGHGAGFTSFLTVGTLGTLSFISWHKGGGLISGQDDYLVMGGLAAIWWLGSIIAGVDDANNFNRQASHIWLSLAPFPDQQSSKPRLSFSYRLK